MKTLSAPLLMILLASGLVRVGPQAHVRATPPQDDASLLLPEERRHLRNVRQLTFGGQNAEAYFSADDKQLIFQASVGEGRCDQMYTMDLAGGHKRMVSTGGGKTTCGYFFPGGKRIVYSSTRASSPECPPPPDYSKGYVWKLFPEFEIYSARTDGSGVKRLTHNPGYDAEATISRDGKKIVFTSLRNSDLDIYTMFEIFVMEADGRNKRQVTRNGAANFAPFFHPDGKRIIFASNMADPNGRNFDLYLINEDGTGLERVTWHPLFDAFPMFSSDGKKLVWASSRNGKARGETNIFLADWVD